MKVVRATKEEINALNAYLQTMEHLIDDNWDDEDEESNKAIADHARKLSKMRWNVVLINTKVLIDNVCDMQEETIEYSPYHFLVPTDGDQ